MKRRFLTTLSAVALTILASCGETEGSKPDEFNPTYPFGGQTGQTLSADGESEDTYDLIEAAGYGIESPDYCGVNTDVQHITQRYDNDLEWYVFDFTILLTDDDRGKEDITDRQRNEIKTDSHSPANLVAVENETVRYHWYFKIPEGWQTTTSFCHIHQLKGYDGDYIDNPVITHSTVTKSGVQQFQVRYMTDTASESATYYPLTTPLEPFIGEWVEVEEKITYSYSGKYSVKITRCSDNEVLASLTDFDMPAWRDGCTAMRPKWGIYRSIGTDGEKLDELRDETISFAEFTIDKQ